jgi:hemerythrin
MESELFTWSEKYHLGISFADVQHKQLADSINRLHRTLLNAQDRPVVGRAMEELFAYSKAHFAAEEKVLRSYGYPDFVAHHSEHECMAFAVLELYQKLMSRELLMNSYSVSFLKEWLSAEILSADSKFTPFLKGKGVP